MEKVNFKEALAPLNDVELKFAPDNLFYLGNFDLLTQGRRVSVVGSRKVSNNGIERAKLITKGLVKQGIIVVSGLAEGVDTIAHQTAIELGGTTVSVLGTPLSKPYPKSNIDLFNKICDEHLAISQFDEGQTVFKSNFPMRNRTMALISDATIIVEASEQSGTKHQGWEALRLGRELYLLQSIVEDPSLTWPQKMLDYGAKILTRKNFQEVLDNIPFHTEKNELVF